MNKKKQIPEKLNKITEACELHARDLLRAAKKLLDEEELPNIAYHLAALALEEIGKSILVGMKYLVSTEEEPLSWTNKHAEDHVRKLFWALWGPSFGRVAISREQIESFRNLAQGIHKKRLRGLYVDAFQDEILLPNKAVDPISARNLIALAFKILELATLDQFKELTEEERKDVDWFLSTTKDRGNRGFIFSRSSMDKLVEIGNVKKWVKWIRNEFEQSEKLAREQVEQELNRLVRPGDENKKNKWKVKVRFYTNSHSIRPKTLNWWNDKIKDIKLFPVDKKKNQLIVEFRFPKSLHIKGLWPAGWSVARRFTVALNIGSFGFFWWYVPEHISRFYENIIDLEAGKEVCAERTPILKLDWKRDALSEQDLRNTAICYGALPHIDDKEQSEIFKYYITGLAFLSKNDLHLQFEANAYEQFYKSLKRAMQIYGEWDGISKFEESLIKLFQIGLEKDEIDKHIALVKQFELIPPTPKNVTLRDVGTIKIVCDAYFLRHLREIAKKQMESMQQEKENASDSSGTSGDML